MDFICRTSCGAATWEICTGLDRQACVTSMENTCSLARQGSARLSSHPLLLQIV